MVVTLTEQIPCVVAGPVESDRGNRIELLFGLVQVHEAHRRALRAVGAVEQHGDVNSIFAEPHILLEAVRPHDLALARQLQASARGRRCGRCRAAGTFNDGDVVDIQDELVVAVEVTDGHIAHAAVCAQVNSVLVPAALGTVAAITAIAHHTAGTLGRHRPLLDRGEVRSVGVASSAHGNGKVLCSIAGILCTGPEADAATESHLRRHKVVVRSDGRARCIAV